MSESLNKDSIIKQERLGIVAGGGQFPRLIAQEARKNGNFVAICGFRDNTEMALKEECDSFEILPLGQLNNLIRFFKDNNIEKVCMAGSINKPRALDLRPDWRVAKLLFSLKTKGDDAILRAILGEFEKEGMQPLSAGDLVPSLRAVEGNLTQIKGNHTPKEVQDSIKYAFPILESLGHFDIGQCIVVRENMVIAVECLEGTDATIERGAMLGGEGCIAIKIAKKGQDQRVDLPSIGLTTIENLIKYKYLALIIEAEKTLFFDQDKALALAKQHNLHIIAIKKEDLQLSFSNEK